MDKHQFSFIFQSDSHITLLRLLRATVLMAAMQKGPAFFLTLLSGAGDLSKRRRKKLSSFRKSLADLSDTKTMVIVKVILDSYVVS